MNETPGHRSRKPREQSRINPRSGPRQESSNEWVEQQTHVSLSKNQCENTVRHHFSIHRESIEHNAQCGTWGMCVAGGGENGPWMGGVFVMESQEHLRAQLRPLPEASCGSSLHVALPPGSGHHVHIAGTELQLRKGALEAV